MGAACKIGNHVREQARRGGDRRVGQASGQVRRPQELLMGRWERFAVQRGRGAGVLNGSAEARRPGKSLGGQAGQAVGWG